MAPITYCACGELAGTVGAASSRDCSARVSPPLESIDRGTLMASTTKKMNVVQLTVLTAVNMMGSGIIMLPTNMAQVGAISLLSWIVTAIGSMAIAYGFA